MQNGITQENFWLWAAMLNRLAPAVKVCLQLYLENKNNTVQRDSTVIHNNNLILIIKSNFTGKATYFFSEKNKISLFLYRIKGFENEGNWTISYKKIMSNF